MQQSAPHKATLHSTTALTPSRLPLPEEVIPIRMIGLSGPNPAAAAHSSMCAVRGLQHPHWHAKPLTSQSQTLNFIPLLVLSNRAAAVVRLPSQLLSAQYRPHQQQCSRQADSLVRHLSAARSHAELVPSNTHASHARHQERFHLSWMSR